MADHDCDAALPQGLASEREIVLPDEEPPGVEIVAGDPPEGWVRAFEVGLADYRAGRTVVCDEETFERLLADAPFEDTETG